VSYGNWVLKNQEKKKLTRIFLGDRIREGDWEKFGIGKNYGGSFKISPAM
jgi:hypothetical protein